MQHNLANLIIFNRQIHFAILNKYILQFEEKNTEYKDKYEYKYIRLYKTIHSSIWEKYILQFETNTLAMPTPTLQSRNIC